MRLILLVIVFALSFQVNAGCWLDGKEHPVGAVVNGYTCGSDGYWK